MDDLISRQAAIDIANDIRACISVDGYWAWMERLEKLPSAQPMMTNAADLINRGDAILAVYKRIKQLGMENDADVLSIRQSIRELASAQPYTEEEIQAMQDLEQAQLDKAYQIGVEEGLRSAQPQWIPCSERLPEVHESGNSFSGIYMQSVPVLVYGICEGEENAQFHVATYCDDLDGNTYWSTELDAFTITEVKAWMPLPEPWKGEQP